MDISIYAAPPKIQSPASVYLNPAQYPDRRAGQSPDFGPAYLVELSGKAPANASNADAKAGLRGLGDAGKTNDAQKSAECQTCKNRKYQDGSDEPGVSFKQPGHIAPENAAAKVFSHEQEHISNAQNEARQDKNKKIVSQSVRMYSEICPECGRSYIAGGQANTVTRTTSETKAPAKNALGGNVDIAA